MVPVLRADSGDLLDDILTTIIPIIEQTSPSDAKARGRNINAPWLPPSLSKAIVDRVEAIAIVAIIEPQ